MEWKGEMLAYFLIRIEGCNFASTILDTNDLSTIRGASLAYLKLPQYWLGELNKAGMGSVETIVVGASDPCLST